MVLVHSKAFFTFAFVSPVVLGSWIASSMPLWSLLRAKYALPVGKSCALTSDQPQACLLRVSTADCAVIERHRRGFGHKRDPPWPLAPQEQGTGPVFRRSSHPRRAITTASQSRRIADRQKETPKDNKKSYKSQQVNQILISFLYFALNNGQCTFRSLVYFCSSSVLSSILNIFCKIYTFDICIFEIYFATVSSAILRLFSAFTERYQSRKFTYHKHFQSLHRHKGKQEAK